MPLLGSHDVKQPWETIRALAGIALVVATTVASMAGPCERDGGASGEFMAVGPLSLPCAPVGVPGSHSDCSWSPCPDSPVKTLIVSRQAGKPQRTSQESSPAFVAGMHQPMSSLEHPPRHIQLPGIDSETLRSTVLLI